MNSSPGSPKKKDFSRKDITHAISCTPTIRRVVSQKIGRAQASRALIAESARAELELNGVLGLRVAEVAKNANCSMTQIYRYFGSRDGLLAQVLGDMYEEFLHESTRRYMETLLTFPELNIDIIVDSLPSIFDQSVQYRQEMRLQVLATSVTNPELKERLIEITREQYHLWNQHLDVIESRLAAGISIDRRVFTMAIATSMPYYRMLLDETGYTNAEYRQFLKDKLAVTSS